MTMTMITTDEHTRPRRGRPRSLRALASLGALLAASLTLWAAGPASAHDQLVESSPAEGETLTSAPSELLLRFSAEILDVGSEVQLLDADGTTVPTDPLALDGTDVTVPLPEPLDDGAYSIEWRVVSSDGHPISGTIAFSVAAATSEPATTASAAAPTTGTPSAGASGSGSSRPEPAPNDGEDDGGVPTYVWALLAIVVGAAAVAVTLVVKRSRSRAAEHDASASEAIDPTGVDRD